MIHVETRLFMASLDATIVLKWREFIRLWNGVADAMARLFDIVHTSYSYIEDVVYLVVYTM